MKLKFYQDKTVLFIICFTIAFIVVEAYVLTNEKKQILSYAKETLKQAVDIDLMQRSEKAGIHKQFFAETHTGDSIKYPFPLHGTLKNGKEFTIIVSKEKDSLNINPINTEEENRFTQSCLCLLENYIHADTLQAIWKNLLDEEGIKLPVSLQLDYQWDSIHHTQTAGSDFCTDNGSSLFYYIGGYFEYTLHAYIQTSMFVLFIHSLYGMNGFIVIIGISLILFLYFRHRATNEMIPIENSPYTYFFNEYIAYNKQTQILYIKQKERKLRNQVALLLTLFIENEEHKVTPEEIFEKIWPKNGTDDKRRNLLRDLRSVLPTKYFKIEKQYKGIYQLQFIPKKKRRFCRLQIQSRRNKEDYNKHITKISQKTVES